MVYLRALDTLFSSATTTNADGVENPNVIRRSSWPDGKVMLLMKGQPRMAVAALNTSTGKHQSPALRRELTNMHDLGGTDWEFISADKYF